MSGEGVDIDLYADDIGEDFNADEFQGDGVDLYDDVITNEGRGDGDMGNIEIINDGRPSTPGTPANSMNSIGKIPNTPGGSSNASSDGHRDSIMPLRKHQVYVGNLTWWTSDKDIQECLEKLDVRDFVEVKFYENRANGQSKGYCVLTVGSDASIKTIHDKLPKQDIHGQTPLVTPPTKQALNQFEAQAKTRSGSTNSGQGAQNNNNSGGGGGMERNGPPNMGMNMMGGPRGPMPMPGMGFGGNPRMMMGGPGPGGMRGGPRGMGPPPPHMNGPPPQMQQRNMGPPNHHGQPGGGGYGGGGPRQMPPQNLPPIPGGPGQRMPMMHNEPFYQNGPQQMGPRGPVGPPGMMDPRGPPPGVRGPGPGDWRPPVNNYPPHGQPQMNQPGPHPGPMPRGQAPPAIIGGPTPAPAPHMNPAFFHPTPNGPPAQGPGPAAYNSPPVAVAYPTQIDHRSSPSMSEAEFEEVMGRNRTVSSSAISRAVSDAATGEFASAIETLVTAISLIKQSKVANDDRCKILVSSLQDTLHGIENKSYGGRRERSRSRERERHRRTRRERTRSREREPYRERSRERYYEYPRERSRSREYRERAAREETSSTRAYYEEPRYRERTEREPRTRVVEPERSREREREPEREVVVSSHRAPRH